MRVLSLLPTCGPRDGIQGHQLHLLGNHIGHFAVTFHVSIINKFCKILLRIGFWQNTFILIF